ncbi:hypothetical protein OJ997_20990 [Solirubrobacter phytolaccae]|uniref:Uncharacterized protein n=1 Tax=Solirubrobacter phytolaccae TaxID=1404360 RepID=A0A9X3NEW2_9ACTN|nr:hypothetical protein [Solirubrobacter phytolaccae]MDA0182801.1 hypothetical protein [Solirubrobacter phytolaccae]
MIADALKTILELSPAGLALFALWMLPDWLRKWIELRAAWTASNQQDRGAGGS